MEILLAEPEFVSGLIRVEKNQDTFKSVGYYSVDHLKKLVALMECLDCWKIEIGYMDSPVGEDLGNLFIVKPKGVRIAKDVCFAMSPRLDTEEE